MKYLLACILACCLLYSCATTARRDKDVETAVRNYIQHNLSEEYKEQLDSLTIISITPINAGRDLALRREDKKRAIEISKDYIKGVQYSIKEEQEQLAGNTTDAKTDTLLKKWMNRAAEANTTMNNDMRVLDSLQHVEVKSEKPAGYYVRARYTIDGDLLKHYTGELMYLVTDDMQVTCCHWAPDTKL